MSDNEYIQAIATRAGELATQCAMNGHPARVLWLPPQTGSDNAYGHFATIDYPPRSASESDPWVTKSI